LLNIIFLLYDWAQNESIVLYCAVTLLNINKYLDN
jgi:hypothetical protein